MNVLSDGPSWRSWRAEICEAALDLVAEGGNNALTHQAIDKRLGVAQGATSYYFPSRHLLVMAVITHLTTVARSAFTAAAGENPSDGAVEHTVDGVAVVIAAQLDGLLGSRRRAVLARYALLPDAGLDTEARATLARALFSPDMAAHLMSSFGVADSRVAASDLLSLLEGLLFDRIYGTRPELAAGTPESIEDLRRPVARWLMALQAV
ncbi:AcrR family transcriptional regulator [Kribbella aluminosa]|uniref:AcrR family transcriptional regulator n=1 Tax=Kribbella aluminosa TaxID=416017 RepID=A0ABS4UWN4_9ACTN|nr:TetR family transcriptional regulator [Kribbella aluminosa]MBP2356060.1 AcrR family transcriptional regulator [Kribbella aluminosa]